MSALRSLFIDELRLKGYSERTVQNYVSAVVGVSAHYKLSPLGLSVEKVKSYLLFLLEQRKFAPATVNLHLDAIKSFFHLMAGGSTIMDGIAHTKVPHRLGRVFQAPVWRRGCGDQVLGQILASHCHLKPPDRFAHADTRLVSLEGLQRQ
jgi:hypothetical protein